MEGGLSENRIGDFLVQVAPFFENTRLCAFTTWAQRIDGSRASFMAHVDELARRELETLLAPLDTTWLSLEHGHTVVLVPDSNKFSDNNFSADGAVVYAPGYAAALTTADCLPIIIASAEASKIAVLHAGWRGIVAGIIEEGARCFVDCCGGIMPEDTSAWVGPSIAGYDYEISDELALLLRNSPSVSATHFTPTTLGHCLADLPAMAQAKLAALGVRIKNIYVDAESTRSNKRYHSHRRDGTLAGRMATVVGILP